jgi:glycerophosphoryl diester phosphodiesterase
MACIYMNRFAGPRGRRLISSLLLTLVLTAELAMATERPAMPIVIAHRGASGYVPEHTLAAYSLAIEQGADYVEPDLVMTKDHVLVARHENEISGTTDVADHPEFAARRTTKVVDGASLMGWFTEDFTLAELKTLRARERIPQLRAANTRFDRQFQIPTFEEILTLVDGANRVRAATAKSLERPIPPPIGIYPETKHPTYFAGIGHPLEDQLLDDLRAHGYTSRSAPIFIQSFEVGNLKRLHERTQLPIIQLVDASGQPFDLKQAGLATTYADLTTAKGLAEVARYAQGVGVAKDLVITRTADGALGAPTALVANAHAAGLVVHAWTFRAENAFLPKNLQTGSAPADHGRLSEELAAFFAAGLDGAFSDYSDIAVRARNDFITKTTSAR